MFRSLEQKLLSKCNYHSIKSLFSNNYQIINKFDTNIHKVFPKKISNYVSINNKLITKRETNKYLLDFNQKFYYSNIKSEQKLKPKPTERSIEKTLESIKSKKRPLRKKSLFNKSQELLPVLAFSTSDEYSLEDMSEAFKEQGLYDSIPMAEDLEDDIIHLCANYQINDLKREVFIFREGSIVCWNMPSVECEALLKFIKPFEISSYEESVVNEEKEEMDFDLTQNSKSRLQKGSIYLNNKATDLLDLEKYAFSNAIALSVKLAIWESGLHKYADSIAFVTQDMKDGEKIKLTRDQVFKKTGELFALKHRINLSSDLLDTPDFYWDRQELEKLFTDTYYHLNINKRVRIMNEKLNHCVELMELLSSHLNDIHHVRLEWMIIILIMVEVVFEFIHYAERLF